MVPTNSKIHPGGYIHTKSDSQLSSGIPRISCVLDESMSLNRDQSAVSSPMIISPHQATGIKIQKIPLQQYTHPMITDCNSDTSKPTLTNRGTEVCQAKINAMEHSSLTSSNTRQDFDSNEIGHLSAGAEMQRDGAFGTSATSRFEPSNSSKQLGKINQLNDALTALNPRLY